MFNIIIPLLSPKIKMVAVVYVYSSVAVDCNGTSNNNGLSLNKGPTLSIEDTFLSPKFCPPNF